MIIYKMKNKITGKVYIGQTRRSFEQRIKEHIVAAKRGEDFYIGQALRKYGESNFECSVIVETDNQETLNKLERYYIQKYHSDIDGYNLAPGGDSNTMDSEKVKAYHDAVMRSEDVRNRISKTLSNRIKSEGRKEEYIQNLRNGFQKYLKSDKFKEDCKNRHLSPEHYRALNDAKNKSVYCIDADENIVAEFSRVKDAAIWWLNSGYKVKSYDQLMDRIKDSSKKNKYIHGLKWIYRV